MKLSHFFVFLFFLLLLGIVSAVEWKEFYDSDESGIQSLIVFNNKLYAGTGTNGKIMAYDGINWSESYDSTETSINSMGVYNGKLYAGSNPNGLIYEFDGSTWSQSYDSSETRILSLAEYDGKLYAGTYPNGKVLTFDGTTWSEAYDVAEEGIYALVEYDNKLFAGSGGGFEGGKIFEFDGSTWSESYDSTEDFLYSLEIFDGNLWAGSSGNGIIYTFDGTTWSESYDSSENSIYSLKSFDNTLYAGSGNFGRILEFADNTFNFSYDVSETAILSMVVYNGILFAGANQNGKIYQGVVPNITILKPINESTGETITTDWKVTATGALQDIDENVPNIAYVNYIDINSNFGENIVFTVEDNNNSYYSRQYYLEITSDMNVVIQPYLVPVESGISYSVKVLDSVTLLPVGNVKLDIFAEVPGKTEKQLVESIITEDKGIGVLSGITLKNYDIHAYYDGVLLTTKTNSVTSNQVYLGLNLYIYSEGGFDLISAYSNLTPSETIVDSKDLNLIFENTASIPVWYNVKIISIDTETNEEKNVLIDTNYFENNFDINSSELNWVNDDYNMLKIRVYVFSDDTNELIATLSFFKMHAPEIVNPTSYWMRHMAYGMREEFGCSTNNIYFIPCNALVFIAVFFSFLVVIGFVFITGYSDYQVVLIGMIMLTLFGIVGWVPAYLLGLMWIITVFTLQSGGWSWRG